MEKLNQCPQCATWYLPTDSYCEIDGAQLTVGTLYTPRLVRTLDKLTYRLCCIQARQPRDSFRWRVLSRANDVTTYLSRKLDPYDLAYDDGKCSNLVGTCIACDDRPAGLRGLCDPCAWKADEMSLQSQMPTTWMPPAYMRNRLHYTRSRFLLSYWRFVLRVLNHVENYLNRLDGRSDKPRLQVRSE